MGDVPGRLWRWRRAGRPHNWSSAAAAAPSPAITFSSFSFCSLLLASSFLLFGVGSVIGYVLATKFEASHPPSSGSSNSPSSPLAAVKGPKPPPYFSLCTDTCSKAKNGVCDDGSQVRDTGFSGPGTDVFCDLGTDCTDCGAWAGAPPLFERGQTTGPIKFLMAEQHVVRVKHVESLPPLVMAYTDPKLDLDVSDVLERVGMLEGGITQIFHEVLQGSCVRSDGSRALVLDVGANFGYFSVYAALHGCRVMAWEPVPLFRAFIHYNLQLNNVSHLVEVRDKVVGARDDQQLEMMVPRNGIWGTASVAGINQFMAQAPTKIRVHQERLDTVVHENVLLVKVDVEGYETMVIRSMAKLIKKFTVENYILEYSPGIAERLYPSMDLLEETPRILLDLINRGYRVMQLNDNYGKAGHVDWTGGVPPLPEVTAGNLKYDLLDAQQYKDGSLGCPKPPEMARFGAAWSQCNNVPEDLHPKSFHSMFSYNTNIWASHSKAKSRAVMQSNEVVGLHALSQDSHSSWGSVARPENGIAMRVCFYLQPHALVRSRCNCSWAVNATPEEKQACTEEQGVLQQMIQEGKMPFAA